MMPVAMPGATAVEMRGTKMIDNTPVTFLLKIVATSECYLDALVAGRASDFPGRGMLEFLGSIGRKVPSAVREPRWIEFHRLPTGPTRAIDVANLKVRGDLVEFTRRYITSFQGRLLMVSQVACSRGESRLLHMEQWSKEGELESRVDYGDQAEFLPGPNDIVHQLLLRALCVGGRPVPPSSAEENLKAVRGW
jgi:hypothetical protein